jgi:hypothetical protein
MVTPKAKPSRIIMMVRFIVGNLEMVKPKVREYISIIMGRSMMEDLKTRNFMVMEHLIIWVRK